ncbi:MAG: GNAT family N-acetyltransferase [Candidatus Heimdallarchaeota archaeon]|nr:MAG: GNAT family N-acetyltransferase [Candidatus Heimdallarchaeota archaeon]
MKKSESFISIFDPDSTSDELWEKYYLFYLRIFKEMFPDDPPPSKECLKKEMENPHPDNKDYRWILSEEKSNNIIGYGRVTVYNKSSPAYQANKHIAFGTLFVDKSHRRLGFGEDLLKILVKKVKDEKKTIFQGGTLLESGKAFCEQFGGIIALTEEESRLKLEEVDWEMLDEWIDEGTRRAEGVTIKRFEVVPEKDLEDYCLIFTETLNQVPKGELEWEANETPEIRRSREKRNKLINLTWTTFISREDDGTISGLTETFYQPDQASLLFQGLTGVKKQYRGRGLGKWLKAEMLKYAKKTFPKLKFVVTDFAVTNAPMIAINKRLGFKKHKFWKEYKFNVDELTDSLKLQ